MKFATSTLIAACVVSSTMAFQPAVPAAAAARPVTTSLNMGFDLSGNTWKPDSEKMGSTDTGDYFPEDYDLAETEAMFTQDMMGSQAKLNSNRDGPALPGMENFGKDAIMTGGIEAATEIPPDMDFTPPTRPDGEFEFSVAGSSSGGSMQIKVNSPCMTFEDFYAAFAPGSHPSLSVSPATGRMDRRNGEPTTFTIACNPNGQAGEFIGALVINLPEDNSKLGYKITAKSY